ncbi:GGDEF-domain containing protein [Mycolicibacterium duvalii]|uniref:GGDEF-domain containing protein n=1 Tax=Mycolicibacterium duvalii TaxID=39688 RepID=A0A7I7JZB9_9MYCO|nr:bifunctional diguanylate cyclase/phosphodiesterase [Mycolicibacterium duvalii]MCV7369742.1 bifunctional diguanylate cyclase/phosphodiesterase [Mycolicibacterium duvalii]PEG43455.1 GGDEF-domain containing protein [Mycolicibacterium duvalii]BBX17226.1 GGDEF-domain containing protein [Mycolicibacterium duvalii]
MPNLRGVAAGAAIGGAAFSVWLLTDWGGHAVIRWVDDLGLVVFSSFAALCAATAASRAQGKDRLAWWAMTAGVAAWLASQLIRTYIHFTSDSHPFPSWVDTGYVLFLAGAGLCLVFLLSTTPPQTQVRMLLDGVIIGAALFGLAWVTVLQTVHSVRAGNPAAVAMALSYPIVDIALITVAVLMLVRAPAGGRAHLAWLAGGLTLIALSDTSYAYLTAVDDQHFHVIAIGWAWGFVCIGLAALVTCRPAVGGVTRASSVPPRLSVWLPYLPVVLSALLCTPMLVDGLGPVFVAAAVTVIAVLIRQFLVLGENRRLLAEVADRAVHDPLTGLANRAVFSDRLAHAMALHDRHALDVSVLVLDLDDFRLVNESFGHRAGDMVLVRVAERLAGTVRASDTLARVGGDAFAVIMMGDPAAARDIGEDVVEAFDRPFLVDGQELRLRPGVGLATTASGQRCPSADELYKRAEVALEAAKHARTGRLVVHTPGMEPGQLVPAPTGCDTGVGSAQLLAELRSAIEQGGLSVVYQPKFDLATDEIVGLEALIRWPHPRRGLLGPDQFLPLVRRHGLMRSLTSVVLTAALDDAARWHALGIGVPVAINVFAPAITDPHLCDQLTAALDERALPPDWLTVEITEDLLLDNLGKTRTVFETLRAKGIRVAIDDFGSGYSALWYLREFPVDEVKLDREFIAPILTHPASAAIARAVIGLAHSLGITPVAEGVENAETAARLREYGCRIAQGFHFSAPLPAPAIQDLLLRQQSVDGQEPAGTRRSEIELMQ